jgi:hypothetical protein
MHRLARADQTLAALGVVAVLGAAGCVYRTPRVDVPAPFGLVLERERLAVELRMDVGGKTLVGRGAANELGSLYSSARRKALAVALRRALAAAR